MSKKAAAIEPREHKTFRPFQIKLDEAKGVAEEIVAVMGNVDEGGDVIHPGAFTKTISERLSKIKCLDQHGTDSILRIVGKPLAMRELTRAELPEALLKDYPDATGALAVTTQYFLDTPEGKGAFVRVKEGMVEYSIGYDPLDIDYSKVVGPGGKSITVRNLRTLKLYEYSPVLWGMNPATMTVSAKENGGPGEAKPVDVTENYIRVRIHDPGDFEDGSFRTIDISKDEGIRAVIGKLKGETSTTVQSYLFDKDKWTVEKAQAWVDEHKKDALPLSEAKAVTPYQNLPIADRARAWDAAAAEKRVREWAGGEDNLNWAKYRRAFFWYDSENAEQFTAYKLGYADIVDGELTAVPRGIFACAVVLQGGRDGLNIPEADQMAIKRQVMRWYTRMAAEFDDESLAAPFGKAADKSVSLSELVSKIEQAFMALYNPPSGPMSYWVREVLDDAIIVCDMRAAERYYFKVGYTITGEDVVFAARPEWVEGRYEFIPMPQEGFMPITGQPGATGGVAAETGAAVKEGRVLSRRNAEALASALAQITDILKNAGLLDEPTKQADEAGPHKDAPTDESLRKLVEAETEELELYGGA